MTDAFAVAFDEIKVLLQNITAGTISHIGEFRSFRTQIESDVKSLKSDLTSLNESVMSELNNIQTSHAKHTHQFNDKLNSLDSQLKAVDANLNDSVSNLSMCLQEHKQQTATELSHLQTSLTSTHSKLDTLTNTTACDNQQIIDNVPDGKCMDRVQHLQLHQSLLDSLTRQLGRINDDVTFIRGPYTCGGTGGWRRVVYLDMTDPCTDCPCGWQLTEYSKRTCGKNSTGGRTCDSAIFPVSGGPYKKICGRINAYQYREPDGFANTGRSIDDAYADGVSLTHGSPRKHIWIFAAGISEGYPGSPFLLHHACPCDTTATVNIPPFVGNDYFCESGINGPYNDNTDRILHTDDVLWDGKNCISSSTCCSLHNPPYFVKQLQNSTTDDIEARICQDDGIEDDYIAVEGIELYVQ